IGAVISTSGEAICNHTHTDIDHLAKPDATTHTLTLTKTLTFDMTLTQNSTLTQHLTLTQNSTLTQNLTWTQNLTLKEFFSEIVVFLVRKGSYTTFNIAKIRKIWEKKGENPKNLVDD